MTLENPLLPLMKLELDRRGKSVSKPSISEYLESLGATPGEIAKSLASQGIKGLRNSKRKNVICNAINTKCSGWGNIKIYGGSNRDGTYSYSATWNDAQICDPRLPKPVQEFLGRFDSGEYPELVATAVKTGTFIQWD